MKKILIIIVIILVVAVVLVGVAYFSGWFSSSAGPGMVSTPEPLGSQPAPTATTTQTPTTTQPAPEPSPAPDETASTLEAFVDFGFVITEISGSGFTRMVTAEVSNVGTADAHNVRANITVTQGDAIIKINGQESLTVQIGTLPAGTIVTIQQEIKFGLLDGMKIQNNGAEFTVIIRSEETTATFSEFYQP